MKTIAEINKEDKQINNNNGNGKVFLKINSAYNHLGKAEKQVATFIKNYPEEVTKLPINVFSEKVGVSVSTIVRLCKRIGIDGYTDLKLELTRDLASSYRETYSEIDSDDNVSSILKKAKNIYSSTISDTFKLLSKEEMLIVCEDILKADSILIIGTGGSGSIASLFYHKLLKFGMNCQWSNDFSTVPLLISKMGKGDLLISISHSGSTNDICEALEMANENKTNTITLTNYMQSPVARLSERVLTTAVSEGPMGSEGGPYRIAQISVIEAICLLIKIKSQEII